MFILDSLFLSGFRWVLDTIVTAAEAEMNDDTALREQLLEAEMRREMGELTDEEFGEIEADLLTRIREIKERREGGSGPIAFGGEALDTSAGSGVSVEATVSGDFHEPPSEPVLFEHRPVTVGENHGTVIEGILLEPSDRTRGESPVRQGGRTPKVRAKTKPARRRTSPVVAQPVRATVHRPRRTSRTPRTKIRS